MHKILVSIALVSLLAACSSMGMPSNMVMQHGNAATTHMMGMGADTLRNGDGPN